MKNGEKLPSISEQHFSNLSRFQIQFRTEIKKPNLALARISLYIKYQQSHLIYSIL
jgi:hypothetical protein